MRGWIITAAILLTASGARAQDAPQTCQPPDASLIKSRGQYTGRADLPDGEKIARYNEQAKRFNECTRKLVDGNNDEIDRVRDTANADIARVREAANRRIEDIQVKLAVSGEAFTGANIPDGFPAPTCRKPDEPGKKMSSTGAANVRQQDEYETCVRDYIARASTAARETAVTASVEMARIADQAKARIAQLKGTVRTGIETANAAAMERSHSVEGTVLGRDDPILMARAAENPLENSKAVEAWPVVRDTPSGEGDPRPITCRAPQKLADSQLLGPKVCRRNGVWAVLRKASKDIGPDGLTIIDLDDRRRTNAACLTTQVPTDAMGDVMAFTNRCN